MKKTLKNVLLEKKGSRLIVKDGKNTYFNDQFKSIPIDELSGQTAATVKVVDNLIVEIRLERGETYPKKKKTKNSRSTPKSSQHMASDKNEKNRDPARGPYNFVPLNEEVVPGQEGVDFDRFAEGKCRLSGVISLTINTLTPIFIRGNKENFLNPKGQLILQGSSIRGMVRNLVELCSHAKLQNDHQYEDRRMYFRAMADKAIRLRSDYKNEIASDIEAGYLTYNFNSRSYSIQPAQGFDRVNSKGIFKYFKTGEGYEIHSGGMQGKKKNWIIHPPNDEEPLQIDPNLIKAYEEDDNRAKQVWDILKIARKGKWKNVDFPDGVPVFFKRTDGEVTSFGHTKNYRLPYPGSVSNHIPAELKEKSYLDMAESIFGISGDKISKIKAGRVCFEDSIPRKLSDVKTQITPLRILGNPKPTTFQHYLEQPDGMNTASRVLSHWGDEDASIRGYKQYWHKVNPERLDPELWTENSLIFKKNDIEKWIKQETSNKDSWQDSSFHLKIERDSKGQEKIKVEGDLNSFPEKLRDILVEYYNIDGSISKKLKIAKPQNSIVNLVLEGEAFESRIRFENLTKEELGALLFVLDLPKGCAHKLGMGKPLGLGSVRITPKLKLIDRKKRYAELFNEDNNGWESGESAETDLKKYKDAFARYIGEKLPNPGIVDTDSYWTKDERMTELKHMLTLEHAMSNGNADWTARTSYMELKEFRERKVLPKPSEVVKKNTYSSKKKKN